MECIDTSWPMAVAKSVRDAAHRSNTRYSPISGAELFELMIQKPELLIVQKVP